MTLFQSAFPIEDSATLAVNASANERRARGLPVYNLSAGEPMVGQFPQIEQGVLAAIRSGKTLYPPVAGIPELRAAAATWFNARYNSNFTSAETVVTSGGKFGIFAIGALYLRPSDEVLMVSPYWVSHPSIVRLGGAVPVVVATSARQEWKAGVADFSRCATGRTKMLMLNSGANPTGALYNRAELKNILDWAAERDLMVVSDEVYSELVYDGAEFVSAGSFPEHRGRVAVVQSMSKHFAMTGWRVGFVLAPSAVIETVTAFQSQSTSGAGSINQWAALAALASASAITSAIRNELAERRAGFAKYFSEYFGGEFSLPRSALYYFLPLSALNVAERDDAAFCRAALAKAGVALVPGTAFGVSGYVRFSFGAPLADIAAGLKALKDFCYEHYGPAPARPQF